MIDGIPISQVVCVIFWDSMILLDYFIQVHKFC